jgi:hypothetical protein
VYLQLVRFDGESRVPFEVVAISLFLEVDMEVIRHGLLMYMTNFWFIMGKYLQNSSGGFVSFQMRLSLALHWVRDSHMVIKTMV